VATDLHWDVESDHPNVTHAGKRRSGSGSRSTDSTGTGGAREAYRQQQIVRFPSRFRKLPILGILLISSFFIVDLTFPWPSYVDLTTRDFLVIRAVWNLFYVLIFATSWWRAENERAQVARDFTMLVGTAAFLGVLCAHTGGLSSPYYAGLVLVTIGRVVILPGFFWRTTLGLGAMVTSFVAVTSLWPAPRAPGVGGAQVVLTVAILVSANGLALIGTWLADRLALGLEAAKIMGRYRLVRRLGLGGMGEVFLAHHASLRRPCAVKILRQELCTPDAVARFEREAEAASRLRHPNTIAVFDFGRTDEGQPYYVMEYLDGCDLRELVQREGPLDPARAEYLLHQTAASLAEAHLMSMVHRDVQPGNLFVTGNAGHGDFIKVLDFGLVKGANLGPEITKGQTFMGTPRYMAPEALTGKPVDARADVYSLGAVGYYLLCGAAPFASDDSHADMYRQVHEAPPPIAGRRPSELPAPSAQLGEVVERCLRKDPGERFANAAELRAALEQTPEHGRWHPARVDTHRPLPEALPPTDAPPPDVQTVQGRATK
jgi:Protein kinase domain